MTDYLALLRQSQNENAPDPNCINRVKGSPPAFAHFVQSPTSANKDAAAALVDMAPGWREREAIEAWRQTWCRLAGEWRAYVAQHPDWRPPSPFDVRCRLAELVHAWNRHTGQQRDPAEVLDRLAPEDYQDAELMTPGCLGLLVALFLEPAP